MGWLTNLLKNALAQAATVEEFTGGKDDKS